MANRDAHAHSTGHTHPHAHDLACAEEHGHNHGHHHTHGHGHHSHAPADFNRAFALGIALNTAFVIVEAAYGWHANSLALLADAGHNLSDVAGLLLAWVASLATKRQASPRYTYGWRRASILAAFANAILLLVAMGSLGWEAVQRLGSPEPSQAFTIIVVASVGIVINAATAWLFFHGRGHDLNIRGAYLHMAADALVSLGVVVGGLLYLWQGWLWLDPVLSLVIALVIVIGTWGLLRESLHLLFDGVPAHIDADAIRQWLVEQPGVTAVDDLHIWAISTTQVALTAHLRMPAGHPGDAFLQSAAQALQDRFGIAHSTLQTSRSALLSGCQSPHTPEPTHPSPGRIA